MLALQIVLNCEVYTLVELTSIQGAIFLNHRRTWRDDLCQKKKEVKLDSKEATVKIESVTADKKKEVSI